GGLRARLVAGDEAIDRRLLLATHGADHVLAGPPLLLKPGEVTDEIARLLLAKQETQEIRRLVRLLLLVHVHDRELRLREGRRDGVDRRRLGEADADRQVITLARERREVRDVVLRRLRLKDLLLDPELGLCPQQPDVGEMVEAAIVQAADVSDKSDVLAALAGGGGRGVGGRLLAASAAACGDEHDEADQYERSLHSGPFR